MSNWNRTTRATATTAALAALALLAPTAATAAPGGDAGAVDSRLRNAPGMHLHHPHLTGAGAPTERSATPGQAAKAANGIQASLDAMTAHGAVGAVARVDSPAYTGAFASGRRALGANPKALPHSEFRVASNTKMMVATLAMQQVERGAWTLQTSIGDVLPGLVPGHDDVTIEQLMSHTSGMPDGLYPLISSRMTAPTNDAFFTALSQDYDDQQIVDAMNSMPWLFAPGTDFAYSNSGYVVLGMMLEKQTGRTMTDLLKRDVLKPAGMNQTTFKTAAGMRGQGLEGAAIIGNQSWSLAHFNPEIFSSAGAVVSTTKDVNAFTKALVEGRLVSPALVQQMMTPRSDTVLEYGLGIYRLPDPCSPAEAPTYLYGHDGGAFGTLSIALTSPDGARQVSLGVTGRHYFDDPTMPQPYDINATLLAMLAATC